MSQRAVIIYQVRKSAIVLMREEAHLAAEDHQSIYFLKMTLIQSQR